MNISKCLDIFFLLKKLNDWYYRFDIDEFHEWFDIYDEYPQLCKWLNKDSSQEFTVLQTFLYQLFSRLPDSFDIKFEIDVANKLLRIDWDNPLYERPKSYLTSFNSQELM